MKCEVFELPVESLGADYEKPTITAVHAQKDDSILCGLLFAKPALVKIPLKSGGMPADVSGSKLNFTNLNVEVQAGNDLLGVLNGLRPSVSGEAVCTLLHSGFLPGVFKGLLGKDVKGKKGAALLEFLKSQEGSGSAVRHSVVHVEPSGDLRSRSFKEPGLLWDVAHVGDFVFGLSGSSVWREPYLKPDKREFLRSDLQANYGLHRDDDGYFWFMGSNQRLLRMGLTDIKAQPTPLKAPDLSGLFLSAASTVDTWLYVTAKNSKTLLRIRRNPISREEELQFVADFDRPVTGLVAVDHPEVRKLFVALEGQGETEIQSLAIIQPEDPEMIPPAPALKSELKIPGVSCVSSLTQTPQPIPEVAALEAHSEVDAVQQADAKPEARKVNWGPKPVLWAAEGKLGSPASGAMPRILRLSDI